MICGALSVGLEALSSRNRSEMNTLYLRAGRGRAAGEGADDVGWQRLREGEGGREIGREREREGERDREIGAERDRDKPMRRKEQRSFRGCSIRGFILRSLLPLDGFLCHGMEVLVVLHGLRPILLLRTIRQVCPSFAQYRRGFLEGHLKREASGFREVGKHHGIQPSHLLCLQCHR